MKKNAFLITCILLLTMSISADALPNWSLWFSRDYTDAHLPWSFRNELPKVKVGTKECVIQVHNASVKFGELTPEENPYIMFQCKYDEKGRLISFTRTADRNYGGSFDCHLAYDDASKRLIEERYYIPRTEKLFKTVSYKYDSKNRLEVIDCYSPQGILWKTKLAYKNGYIERSEYKEDGSLIYLAKDYKDAKGRIIRIESDESVLSSIYHHTETISYTNNGLISKIDFRQFSIRNGQRHPFQENGTYYDTYQYKYDKDGNWTDRILTQQYVGTRIYQWVHIEYFK